MGCYSSNVSCNLTKTTALVVILISFIVHDIVEPELIDTLGGRNDTKPVSKLLLFEILLGEVLEVAARKLLVRHDFQLSVPLLANDDILPQIPSATLDFNSIVKEFLESRNIKDLIIDRLRAVDDEFLGDLLTFFGG